MRIPLRTHLQRVAAGAAVLGTATVVGATVTHVVETDQRNADIMASCASTHFPAAKHVILVEGSALSVSHPKSPITEAYETRIATSVALEQRTPSSVVIFSGGQKPGTLISEGLAGAERAVNFYHLDPEKALVEPLALTTKENLENGVPDAMCVPGAEDLTLVTVQPHVPRSLSDARIARRNDGSDLKLFAVGAPENLTPKQTLAFIEREQSYRRHDAAEERWDYLHHDALRYADGYVYADRYPNGVPGGYQPVDLTTVLRGVPSTSAPSSDAASASIPGPPAPSFDQP